MNAQCEILVDYLPDPFRLTIVNDSHANELVSLVEIDREICGDQQMKRDQCMELMRRSFEDRDLGALVCD